MIQGRSPNGGRRLEEVLKHEEMRRLGTLNRVLEASGMWLVLLIRASHHFQETSPLNRPQLIRSG